MITPKTLPAALPALALLLLAACGPVESPPAATASPAAGTPASPEPAGPSSACAPENPNLLHYARWLATEPDERVEEARRRYDIEKTPISEVQQVHDSNLCARAGEAYRDALELTGPAPDVAVIRIGDRYVVTRPAGRSTIGELSSAAVLDESMRVLGVFRR